jgi:hypothetical protein
MLSIARTACKIILAASFLLLLPVAAGAQAVNLETVTIQVDVTAPTGTQVTGTVLVKRQPGTTRDDISFVGIINGSSVSLKATGTEAWSSPTDATLTVDTITQWDSGLGVPALPVVLHISQSSAGLLSINGVTVAFNGQLKAPGSGSASYVVTNPGSGAKEIALLPKTGGSAGSASNDFLLIVVSMIMILSGWWLWRLQHQAAPYNTRAR